MPQYRKLYTKTTESLDINEMPDDFTRLLWLTLPLGLDREGRGMDMPAWIKAKVMPLREDVTYKMITTAMNWYADRGMIERYTVNNRNYFLLPTWHKYQGNTTKEKDSDFPAPIYSRPTPDLLQSNSSTDADADSNADSNADADADTSQTFSDFSLPVPETPKQALEHPAIQVFQAITSRIPGKANYAVVIETLQLLRERARAPDPELIMQLKPYWITWISRKRKDNGKPYSKDGLIWLTEWAVNQEIPPENGSAEKPPGGVSRAELKAQGYTFVDEENDGS